MTNSQEKHTPEAVAMPADATERPFVILWAVDAEGVITLAEGSGLKSLGVKPEELVGKSVFALYPEAEPLLRKCLEGQEYRAESTVGGILLDTTFVPIRDKSGKITGAVGSSIDITQSQKIKEALRVSEERLGLAMSIANDGMWDWDMVKNTSYFDPRYYRMAGYEPNEFPGTLNDWEQHVHPDDLERVRAASKAYLAGEIPSYDVEFRFKRKDGEWMWIRGRGKVVAHSGKGKPLRFVGTHSDISARKQAEEALRASEANYRTLFEQAADGVFIADLEGKIIDANIHGCQIVGYERDELLKLTLNDLLPQKHRNSDPVQFERLLSGETITRERELLKRDGTILPVEISTSVTADGRIQGFVRDITMRKQAETALRANESKLREAQQLAHLGYWYLDVRTGDVEWSDEVFRIFRLNPKEYRPHIDSIMSFSPWPEDHERDKEIIRKAIESHEAGSYEQKFLRSDGSIGHYFSTFQGIYDDDNNLIAIRGTVQDTTARKLAEEALKEATRNWQTTFDAVNDVVWLLDNQHRIIMANCATTTLLGRKPENVLGFHCWEIVHGTARPIPECPVSRVKRSLHRESMDLEIDGRHFRVMVDPVIDAKGAFAGCVHIITDITEQKKAEEGLRESGQELARMNRALRMLSDSNQALIRITDETALLDEVCKVAVETGGYRFAWVGFAEQDEAKSVRPAAYKGADSESFNAVQITWADNHEHGRGPTGIAIRTGKPCIAHNIPGTPAFAPSWEAVVQDDCQSSISLPLICEEKTIGVLCIYSDNLNAFDSKEVEILRELSGDVAFGISALRSRAERQRAEAALLESEMRFRQVFEANAAVKLIIDPRNGAIVEANQAAADFYGYSIDQLRAMTMLDINYLPSGEIMAAMKRAETEKRYHLNFKHRLASGEIRDVEVYGCPFSTESGVFLYSIVHDITERKRAEEALQSLYIRQDAILAAIPDIVAEVDKNKVYTWANQAGKEFFGDEMIGMDASFYFVGQQEIYRTVQPLFEGAEETIYIESWQRRKDGQKRLLAWWCRTLKDVDGNVTGALSTARDITEQRQMEEVLRASEEVLRESQAVAGLGNYILDIRRGQWVSSQILDEIFGIDADFERTPAGWLKIVHPDWREIMDEYLRKDVIEKRGRFDKKYKIVRQTDGEELWVHGLGRLEIDSRGRPARMIGTIQDITQQQQAEDALRRSEVLYRSLFENMLNGMVFGRILFDNGKPSDFIFLSANEACKSLIGMKDVVGKKISELIPGVLESDYEIGAIFGRVALTGNPERFEYHLAALNMWLSVSAYSPETEYIVVVFDVITERKRAEKALSDSEQRYRNLIENMGEGTGSVDLNEEFTFVNPAGEKIFGLEKGHLVGRNLLEFMDEEQTALIRLETTKRGQGLESTYELEIIRQDGQHRNLIVTASPQYDENKHLCGTFAVFRDITERKLAEREIRYNEERYRAFISKTSEGVWCWDVDEPYSIDLPEDEQVRLVMRGRISEANGAVARQYGFSRAEEMIGKTFGEFIGEEEFFGLSRLLVAARYNVSNVESEEMDNAGNRHSYINNSVGIIEDGRLIRIWGTQRDITERKLTEQALRDQSWRLESIIEGTQVGTWEWNVQTGVTVFNETWAQIAGYTLEELEPISIKTWETLSHPDDLKKAVDLLNRHFSGELPYYECEMRTKHKEGHWIWILDRGRVVTHTTDGKPLLMFGTHTDITERKRTEEELRISEDKFRSIVEESPMGMHMYDMNEDGDLILVGANPSIDKMLGLKHSELVGKTILEAFPGLVSPQVIENYRQAAINGTQSNFEQIAYEGKAIIGAFEVHAFQTKPYSLVAMIQDITDRKKTDNALRESEEKLRAILASMEDLLFVLDLDGTILDYRAPVGDKLYVPPEVFIGKSFRDVIPSPAVDCINEAVAHVISTGEHAQADYSLDIGGNTLWFDARFSPHRDNEDRIEGVTVVIRDISKRKQAEFALQASEQQLRSIFHVAPTGIGVLRDREFINVNDQVCRMVGRSREELIGQNTRILYPSTEEYEAAGRIIYQQVNEVAIGSTKSRWVHKDGHIINILLSATPIETDEESKSFTFTALDITQQTRSEIALRESEQQLRAIFHVAPTGIGVVCDRVFTDVNDLVCRMVGYSREELIGQSARMVYATTEEFEWVGQEKYRQISETGSGTVKTHWVHRDGHVLDILLSSTPIDIDDLSKGVTFTALDITQQTGAELALLESETRYRTLFDYSPDGVMLMKDGLFVACNQKTIDLFQSTRENIIGQPPDALSPDKQPDGMNTHEAACFHLQNVQEQGYDSFEWMHQRANGEQFDAEVQLIAISLSNEPHIVAFVHDVSERKRTEKEREVLTRQLAGSHQRLATMSRQMLDSQEQERRRIARELHDEIGQLLTAMKINLQSLMNVTRTGRWRSEYKTRLTDQESLIDNMIQQIRQIALELRPSILDDLGLLPAIRWYLDQQVQRGKIRVTLKDSSLPDRLDPALENTCYRVLQEAMTNILRHAHADHVNVFIGIESDNLRLVVQDNGQGFDVEQARSRAAHGESFGLLGMQERIELVGGTLIINSSLGKGTEIITIFPQGDKSPSSNN